MRTQKEKDALKDRIDDKLQAIYNAESTSLMVLNQMVAYLTLRKCILIELTYQADKIHPLIEYAITDETPSVEDL